MSMSYTEEPRMRRERTATRSNQNRQEQPIYTPQSPNDRQQRRRHGHRAQPSSGVPTSPQFPVPVVGPALSDSHHLHHPEVGAFSVDPNVPTLGFAASEEARIFDTEHPQINPDPATVTRGASTKKIVGGLFKGVKGVGGIPKAMMNNYNEGYERRMARPRPAVQIPVDSAAIPPMQIPRSAAPLSSDSHTVYPTSSGHGDAATTLVNHDPPSFIPPSTHEPKNKSNIYGAKQEEQYGGPSPPPATPFRRFLSRISQFIHDINDLPWISPGRVTVDYIPEHGKRSRAVSENSPLPPQFRYYLEPANGTRPLRQTLSWYDNLQNISVTLNPQDAQSIAYISPNQPREAHVLATTPVGAANISYPSPIRASPQFPNGYVPTQPTNMGAGIFSSMPNSSTGHEPMPSPHGMH